MPQNYIWPHLPFTGIAIFMLHFLSIDEPVNVKYSIFLLLSLICKSPLSLTPFLFHPPLSHLPPPPLSLTLSLSLCWLLIFSSSITSGEEEEEEEEGCVRWKRGSLWISSSLSAGSHLQYAQHLAAGRSPLRAHGSLFRGLGPGSSGYFSNYHDRPLFLEKGLIRGQPCWNRS